MLRSTLLFCCILIALIPAPARAADPDATPRPETSISPDELASLGRSFALVNFYFKRNLEEGGGERGEYGMRSDQSSFYEMYIQEKKPLTLIGVVIAPDRVATLDVSLDNRWIDKIEVADLAGNASPARRDAVLKDQPGMLFSIQKPAGLKVIALPLVEYSDPVTTASAFYEVSLHQDGVDFMPRVAALRPSLCFTPEGGTERCIRTSVTVPPQPSGGNSSRMYQMMRMMSALTGNGETNQPHASILLDGKRRPIGVIFAPSLHIGEDGHVMALGSPARMPAVTVEQLEAARKRTEDLFKTRLAQVRIFFRQKARGSRDDIYSFDMEEIMDAQAGSVPKDIYVYGIPVGDNLLFVPNRMPRAYARAIERISVSIGGKELKGTFGGAFKDVGAFLVATDDKLPVAAADMLSSATAAQYQPMLTALASHRMGGMHLQMSHGRIVSRMRGYKNAVESLPSTGNDPGMIFTDMDGRIAALLLHQRRDDEAKEQFRQNQYASSLQFQRFYPVAEISALWKEPNGRLDPRIAALNEDEAKRRLWLGAACEPMTKELAEGFKIEKQTKDGEVGLMITLIYPGSPAEKIGLKTGDILLSLCEKGESEPIELKNGENYSYDYSPGDVDVPRELQRVGWKMPRKRPWKSQISLLTRLLEVYGEGSTVELVYLDSARARQTKSFTVEKAPHDYDNAPRFKHEPSGLTVREITYDVKQALNLPAATKCLVVSEVQQGSPAAVAKVEPYDLILKIDGQDVPDIAAFKGVMKKAVDSKAKLRLNLQYLDKTRFTDLTLGH